MSNSQMGRVSSRGGRARRYVACGDSNTDADAGEANTYAALAAADPAMPLTEVIDSGVPGSTITRCRENLATLAMSHSPSIVSLMFGTNDHSFASGQDTARVSLADFESDMRAVIATLAACGCRVVLMTPPYTSTGTNGLGIKRQGARLRTYVAVVRALAVELRLPLCDTYALTETLCEGKDSKWESTYASDGVHLNALAHRYVYAQLRPFLTGAA